MLSVNRIENVLFDLDEIGRAFVEQLGGFVVRANVRTMAVALLPTGFLLPQLLPESVLPRLPSATVLRGGTLEFILTD